MASVWGNSGNNTLTGTAYGDDIIVGYDGSDTLYGRGGDDELHGGIGYTDQLYGGTGNDTYVIKDNLDVVHEYAGEGTDTVNAYVSYVLTANVENLNLIAGTIATGNSLDNVIIANAEDNVLVGGRGNDILDGGGGTDTADYSHWNSVTAAVGADFDLSVVFDGATLLAEGRNLSGPTIRNGLDDGLRPIESDTLRSIENIRGTNFDDRFHGSTSDNVLWGRGGNDTYVTDLGNDTLIGGTGIDTVDYSASSATSGIIVSIDSGVRGTGGFAQGDLLSEIENVIGTNGNDTIIGNGEDNRLSGERGDDNLGGGDGDDTLIGGQQIDIDRLSGGAGFDTFLYLSRDDSRNAVGRTGDAIQDFNVNEDLIDLQALNVSAGDILIENRTFDGITFATVTEDANHNGGIDAGEFSINIRIEGAGSVTIQDLVL
jgi:Ca2+-binding RTX toxin-like protein